MTLVTSTVALGKGCASGEDLGQNRCVDVAAADDRTQPATGDASSDRLLVGDQAGQRGRARRLDEVVRATHDQPHRIDALLVADLHDPGGTAHDEIDAPDRGAWPPRRSA